MLRSLELKKTAHERLTGGSGELFRSDVDGSLKSLVPGEWILLRDSEKKRVYLAFANPLVPEGSAVIRVVEHLRSAPKLDVAESYVTTCVRRAIETRKVWKSFDTGCRLVYGDVDGLPGLVVDGYAECNLAQINTAGIERFRDLVRNLVTEVTGRPTFIIDNPKLRSREVLPHHHDAIPVSELKVLENGFRYTLPMKNVQKAGWYYDHRENRLKLEQRLRDFAGAKASGLDLFCYAGAWGLHLLRAGVQNCIFVDQAPLQDLVEGALAENSFDGRGRFVRADVFDWLDEAAKLGSLFDVIVSDPPAFAKSPKEKAAAIEGYRKLHRKVLALAAPGALVAFASCTYYVDLDEFDRTISHAAQAAGRRHQILDIGFQGSDHPVRSLAARGNYIKYVLTRVE